MPGSIRRAVYRAVCQLAAWKDHPEIRPRSPSPVLRMQPAVRCATSGRFSGASATAATGAVKARPRFIVPTGEEVAFPAQNPLLANLAPMKREAATRQVLLPGGPQWWVLRLVEASPGQNEQLEFPVLRALIRARPLAGVSFPH